MRKEEDLRGLRSALVYDLCEAKRALRAHDAAHPERAALVEQIETARRFLREFDRQCPEQVPAHGH